MTIAVVIPCYNCSGTILSTLDSVFKQTYMPDQIICVDDGSTDTTLKILESVKDQITIVRQKNLGVSKARNKAIELVNSDFIAFLDADDIWDKNHLYNLSQVAETGTYSIIGASYYKLDVADSKKWINASQPQTSKNFQVITLHDYCKMKAENKRIFWTSAIIAPTKLVRRCGGFDENYTHGEDQALWLQLMTLGNGAKLSCVTAVYVQSSHSATTKVPTKHDAIIDKIDDLIASGLFMKHAMNLRRMQRQYYYSHLKNCLVANDLEMSRHYYQKYIGQRYVPKLTQSLVLNKFTLQLLGRILRWKR